MQSETSRLIGAREASVLLNRDKGTVIRWTREGVLTVVAKLPGKNGALFLDRDEVLGLAASLDAHDDANDADT